MGHLDHRQRRCDGPGWICLVFGMLLGCVGLVSLYGFSTVDVHEAEAFEQRHAEQKQIEEGPDPTTDIDTTRRRSSGQT